MAAASRRKTCKNKCTNKGTTKCQKMCKQKCKKKCCAGSTSPTTAEHAGPVAANTAVLPTRNSNLGFKHPAGASAAANCPASTVNTLPDHCCDPSGGNVPAARPPASSAAAAADGLSDLSLLAEVASQVGTGQGSCNGQFDLVRVVVIISLSR